MEVTFAILEGVFSIGVDMITTVAMAALLLVLGYFIKSRVQFLQKYCIPAAVVGGFLFMLVTWAGQSSGAFAFNFTTTLQATFMLAFFTTVGLGASLSLLKKGGALLVVYWLVAGVVSVFQNIIGVSLAPVTGLENAYALLCSAITLIGGHGAGAAYGGTFESMG